MKNNSKNRKLIKIRLKNELRRGMKKYIGKEITDGLLEDVKVRFSEIVVNMNIQQNKPTESVRITIRK